MDNNQHKRLTPEEIEVWNSRPNDFGRLVAKGMLARIDELAQQPDKEDTRSTLISALADLIVGPTPAEVRAARIQEIQQQIAALQAELDGLKAQE